jgi:hypothetical protein
MVLHCVVCIEASLLPASIEKRLVVITRVGKCKNIRISQCQILKLAVVWFYCRVRI